MSFNRHFNLRARALGVGFAVMGLVWATASPASAATPVELGTAAPFAVLAGSEVTNVGPSAITGDVGLSPAAGTNYAGLTPVQVSGSIYAVDTSGPAGVVGADSGLLTLAQNDLTTAFTVAAARTPTQTFSAGDNQLGGKTLTAGVYAFGHATTANITAASPLVLNGQGDDNSVFIFQASSDLVTASNSVVQLENGAQACHVFWVVGSSATLATSSTFVGTLMALDSATLATGATVQGRILARSAAVTLDHNTITVPTTCATTSPTTTTTTTSGSGATTSALGAGSGASASSGSGGAATTSAAGGGAIPVGAPGTGLGGASMTSNGWLVATGIVALVGSGVVTGVAIRRRRPDPMSTESTEG